MDQSIAQSKLAERKVVGFFQQIRIILWKNTLLMLKNKIGTLIELIMPLLLMGALFLIIYLDSDSMSNDYKNSVFDPINEFNYGISSYNLTANYLYHPDNELARSIVMSTIDRLRMYFRVGLNGEGCQPYCDFRLNGKSFLLPSF